MPARLSGAARKGAKSRKNDESRRMRAINRLQRKWHTITSELHSQRRSEMRNEIEIAVVAKRVCLHPPNRFLCEIRRKSIFPDRQLIRAVYIFETRPKRVAPAKP